MEAMAPGGEDCKVMQALEGICNVMHEASFGAILGNIGVGIEGDVSDLKKWLQRGLTFDKLFRQASGDEKIKLHQLLSSRLRPDRH